MLSINSTRINSTQQIPRQRPLLRHSDRGGLVLHGVRDTRLSLRILKPSLLLTSPREVELNLTTTRRSRLRRQGSERTRHRTLHGVLRIRRRRRREHHTSNRHLQRRRHRINDRLQIRIRPHLRLRRISQRELHSRRLTRHHDTRHLEVIRPRQRRRLRRIRVRHTLRQRQHSLETEIHIRQGNLREIMIRLRILPLNCRHLLLDRIRVQRTRQRHRRRLTRSHRHSIMLSINSTRINSTQQISRQRPRLRHSDRIDRGGGCNARESTHVGSNRRAEHAHVEGLQADAPFSQAAGRVE